MSRRQIVLWIFLGCIGVAMVAGAFAILFPGAVEDEVLGTIFTVGAYSFGGLIVVAVGGRMRLTSRVCGVASGVSLATFLVLIWFDNMINYPATDWIVKIALSFLVIGLVSGHRLVIWPLKSSVLMGKLLRWGALISAMIIGIAFVFFLMTEQYLYWWDDWVVKVLGLLSLVAAGTSIGSGAFAIFGPKPEDNDPGLIGAAIQVSMTCPRCGVIVEAQSNRESRCSGCRLKIRVEVEEPRCSCGYLLYQLEADTCPECGKAIAADDRWGNEDRG